jgi:hypothetical protein
MQERLLTAAFFACVMHCLQAQRRVQADPWLYIEQVLVDKMHERLLTIATCFFPWIMHCVQAHWRVQADWRPDGASAHGQAAGLPDTSNLLFGG